MSCPVYLFSILADRIGSRQVRADLSSPIRAGDLLDELAVRYVPVAELRGVIRVAVNHVYVGEDEVIRPGDEVALITPTSGG